MNIRNIAIIAHVDHGKTTLVDALLKQTHTFRDNQAEMSQTTILDSNDLERERGITILAKNTVVQYKDTKINIIDTPGHADFAGEVERIIGMVDGAVLIVDSAEGPLPQTRFVLTQALKRGLKMIVVINKIDRGDAEPKKILSQVEDLFLEIAGDESQLHFPVIYAVGREGKAWKHLPSSIEEPTTIEPLFEQILETIPAPTVDREAPFKMQVAHIDFDTYKGTYAIGKINQGTVKPGQAVNLWLGTEQIRSGQVVEVYVGKGLGRELASVGEAGDIIALTGLGEVALGITVADPAVKEGYEPLSITEPTLQIGFSVNSSPLAGREGDFHTIRQIGERLERETKTNLGMRLSQNTAGNGYLVAGRGELHLSVLIETMRREGYEFEVGKPQVLLKDIDGVQSEPFEKLTVMIPGDYVGVVVEELGRRKAQMEASITDEKGVAHMEFIISSRNLLGFRSEIVTKTRGNGLFASEFIGYKPMGVKAGGLRNGVIVATEQGATSAYALEPAQKHGSTFVGVGVEVYEGMIVGVTNRPDSIDVNVVKIKKSTNVRAASADLGIQLAPPVEMPLERCLDFIEDDELIEVTPKNIRLRKRVLNRSMRGKRQQ